MTLGCYRLFLGYEAYAGHNLFEHEVMLPNNRAKIAM
jgi:hypothetical protein